MILHYFCIQIIFVKTLMTLTIFITYLQTDRKSLHYIRYERIPIHIKSVMISK